MSVLLKIFEEKKAEVEAAKCHHPESELIARAMAAHPPRGFRSALVDAEGLALIAEVKKASPSRGVIREDFNPISIALDYQLAGAHCISVLTDAPNFQGSLSYLRMCREATTLPCLRKDFIYDRYQVFEARAYSADAILLIAAMLDRGQMEDLMGEATALGMDVLVEVHTDDEARVALDCGADLIGVNNRDLSTFRTDLSVSERILPFLKDQCVTVSESGLESRSDLDRVEAAGARAVLIGTAFCAAPDIRGHVCEVMGW